MTQSPDEARPRVKGSQTAMAAAYLVAIVLGVCSGLWGGETIHAFADFVSSIFIRLFKFISIPIIAVSIIATLASISRSSESGRIFRHTIFYTLFTTILAATLAAVLYVAMSPANVAMTAGAIAPQVAEHSYLEYIQSVIPDNFLAPFLSANVLSVLLVSAAIGIAISRLPRDSRSQEVLLAFFTGAQEVLFILVKWLIRVLPIGIFGFISALVVEMNKGVEIGGLGTYFGVILAANFVQMLVVLPLLMLARGVNPIRVAKGMAPALARRLLLEVLRRHAARHDVLRGKQRGRRSPRLPLRAADLHDDQHERLRRLHPRYGRLPDAECGCRGDAADARRLDPDLDPRGRGQRRRSDGLLLPFGESSRKHERAHHAHGRDPALLRRHRHDRNDAQRLVRLHGRSHGEP